MQVANRLETGAGEMNARHIGTKTYRHWDKSAPGQIGTWTNRHLTLDKSALWTNFNVFWTIFMFILHLVKNTGSQILVNEDRSICLPIVREISQSTIFPWSATFLLLLNKLIDTQLKLLRPMINCYDYFNNILSRLYFFKFSLFKITSHE